MSEINEWDKVAANNNDAPPNGWPENMNYSEVNNAAREGMSAHARLYADMNGTLTTAGSANAYTLTANRTLSAYTEGLTFKFKANHASTGAATINVNGLGAKDLKMADGSALTSNDIVINGFYLIFYTGVHFILSPYITNNNQLANGAGYLTSANTIIGTDTDINTSGATVIDQLNMTSGVIQSHSTRTMTLANLGYTGATDANNYTHPSYTTRSINTSGAQVLDTFTSDGLGSVTGITTRTMTLADLGYTGATNANYITNNNQLTNGAGYVTSSGNTIIGTDSDINTSGAVVVDQLNMTDGVIQSHSTRTMTLADLGYTGATNANNYTHPSYTTRSINTSGAQVLDTFTSDSIGSVTGITTRTMTLADLGYTGATNANYITNNNQLSNGAGYVTTSGWTSSNDGPGTGMNSDLLDDLHATDILTMRQNLRNASYTLALSDIGKTIYKTDNFARTWTIPPNSSVAFPIGTAITMIHDHNGGVLITIARGAGVSLILAGDGTDKDCSLAGYGVATIIKVETDKWYCSGNGVT